MQCSMHTIMNGPRRTACFAKGIPNNTFFTLNSKWFSYTLAIGLHKQRLAPSSSYLRVYMGCALAVVFQVRSIYVPLTNGPLFRVRFGESLVVRLYSEIDHIHLGIEAQCVITLLPLGDCHTNTHSDSYYCIFKPFQITAASYTFIQKTFPGNVWPAEGQGGNPIGKELVYIANYMCTSAAIENSKALVLVILPFHSIWTSGPFNKLILRSNK